ncbi:hypothetical protein QUA41_00270 [Microcoleus sp. Pol11C1]|uniref:hypothetical protein n=1 Tax=Microcoleus sp. POL1_C1 TaxID=2818870 RepID=UPI002FD3E887
MSAKFKGRTRFQEKIAIGRRFEDDRQRKNFAQPQKYRQLINIDERQSAIISVAVTDFYASAIGIKKTGYRSRLNVQGIRACSMCKKNCLKPGKIS